MIHLKLTPSSYVADDYSISLSLVDMLYRLRSERYGCELDVFPFLQHAVCENLLIEMQTSLREQR